MPPAKGWRKRQERESNDPESFVSYMHRYHHWLRVHHYADLTIESSERCLWRFFDWCAERDITRPSEVNRAMLERYQRWLFHHRLPQTGKQPQGVDSA